MRKLYAAFVNIDVERLFVYRMSEKPIKQEFSDGTIETDNYLLAADGHYTKFCGTCGLPLDCTLLKYHGVLFTERGECNPISERTEKRHGIFYQPSFQTITGK